MKKLSVRICALVLAALLAIPMLSCAVPQNEKQNTIDIFDEAVPLAAPKASSAASAKTTYEAVQQTGAPVSAKLPNAPGITVYENGDAKIDASNARDGYVMIRVKKPSDTMLKVIVACPSGVNYTYSLSTDAEYEVFPLSDGNGKYNVTIYKNTRGTKYVTVYGTDISVKLKDEFAPFLLPNQYVNYKSDSKAVKLAAELVKDKKDTLDAVKAIYEYVIENVAYDKAKATTVKSGYLPDVDSVLASKKGICFDYAALMTAMLRSQNIPCKLVVGYVGTLYHAWINIYTKEQGWINTAIFFDGISWKLMDPTFASSSGSSESVAKYIGDGKNYSAKYLY